MKPDVITVWPYGADYPLWRKYMEENRSRFGQILVVLSPTGNLPNDYRQWVRFALDSIDVKVLDAGPTRAEWRDDAVNMAIDELEPDSKWTWFTEQDFLIRKPTFWRTVESAEAYGAKLMGVPCPTGRWHPCCLFVRTPLIYETPRWFGPDPGDHFASFGCALERLTDPADISCAQSTYWHISGLTHNHMLLETQGPPAIGHKPGEFARYLEECLTINHALLHAEWKETAQRYVQWYKERHG